MAAQPVSGVVVRDAILEGGLLEDETEMLELRPIDLSGMKAEFDPSFKEPGRILHEASCFAPYIMVHCGFLGETRTTLQCMFSCADTSWSDERRHEVRKNCDIYAEALETHKAHVKLLADNSDVFVDLRDLMP